MEDDHFVGYIAAGIRSQSLARIFAGVVQL